MNRNELADDPEETQLSMLSAWQARIWTALPAIIQSMNFDANTVEALPTIQASILKPDGSDVWETMPLLVDCPIIFPGGGGYSLTFPLQAGDEVLILFSNRCIDAWWQSGGVQVQAEFRMHDLSDGFAIPSPRSKPRAIPDISSTSVQLRRDDGTAFVEIQADGDVRVSTESNVIVEADGDIQATAGGSAEVTATTSISVVAPLITLTGNVAISGGTLTHNGVNVGSTHVHGGVSIGGSNTSTPT